MLDVCQQWAKEAGTRFAPTKSFLMHFAGPPPPPGTAIFLGEEEVKWVTEFRYLGVTIKAKQASTAKVPLEMTKLWAAFNGLRHVMDPRLPVPLHAQLLLFVTDILAGPLYPAAVQDIDYRVIDIFVNKRLRQITGCPQHTSATLLRCELGVIPSQYLAHRRQLQFWFHIHRTAWFGEELGRLAGTGPYERLKRVAIKYGLPTLDDGPVGTWSFINKDGKRECFGKESWTKQVYLAVTTAAFAELTATAQSRQYDGPIGITKFSKSGTLQIEPRRYVTLGGDLAKYGVQYRQALQQGQQTPWRGKCVKTITACRFCGTIQGDLVHLLHACPSLPEDIRTLRSDVVRSISADDDEAVRGLQNLDWKGVTAKEMKVALTLIRKASKLVEFEGSPSPVGR